MEGTYLKDDVTRRQFFSHLCSGDSLKGILGAWYGFNVGVNKANKLSCEEAGLMFGEKARKKNSRLSKIIRKEG